MTNPYFLDGGISDRGPSDYSAWNDIDDLILEILEKEKQDRENAGNAMLLFALYWLLFVLFLWVAS